MSCGQKLFGLAGAVLVSAALWPGLRGSKPTAAPERTKSDYVDSAVCAGCHQDIFKTFRLTGIGRSLFLPRAENTVEDYHEHNRLYNQASDRYCTMLERDGKRFQRRHQIGFGGKETNVVEKQVDYVIGSGNHVRSYLSRTAEGKLIELPVSWYGLPP